MHWSRRLQALLLQYLKCQLGSTARAALATDNWQQIATGATPNLLANQFLPEGFHQENETVTGLSQSCKVLTLTEFLHHKNKEQNMYTFTGFVRAFGYIQYSIQGHERNNPIRKLLPL